MTVTIKNHFLNTLTKSNMNVIYVCKVSDYQANGNQVDIPKKIAVDFFGISEDIIESGKNIGINICHRNDLKTFEIIELQPATNLRWSTKLNSFLDRNNDSLSRGCLLLFEKLGRLYCIHTIKNGDAKYSALVDLFEEGEKHMLLTASLKNEPTNTKEIKPNYRPYITAIKSKPFLLLAGISGTGKSRIVRELARACWDVGSEEYKTQKPNNFEMIQVKPNWHDSSELIGYVSRIGIDKDGNPRPVYVPGDFLKFVARAWEELDVPYFLCLDEMNLAQVEQYFAEYLSVIESRKLDEDGNITTDPIIRISDESWYHPLATSLTNNDSTRARFLKDGICLPPNLIVVGTVNMDETTFSFSRKVLDRAMTIEMNEVDLKGGLEHRYEQIGKLGAAELIGNAVEGVDVYEQYRKACDLSIDYLENVNKKLEGTPFKIAYRTRNEVLLYVVNNLPYQKEDETKGFVTARALDEITNMKILSRIEGDESKVSHEFLNSLGRTIQEGLEAVCNDLFTNQGYTSVSLTKLDEMKKRLESGYTSFWS